MSAVIELRRRGCEEDLFDPDRRGLLAAAGDSGHAFKFTPLPGTLITDALERKPNPSAKKFAWRARGELKTGKARFVGE